MTFVFYFSFLSPLLLLPLASRLYLPLASRLYLPLASRLYLPFRFVLVSLPLSCLPLDLFSPLRPLCSPLWELLLRPLQLPVKIRGRTDKTITNYAIHMYVEDGVL